MLHKTNRSLVKSKATFIINKSVAGILRIWAVEVQQRTCQLDKNEVETKMRENIFDSLIESDSLFVDRQAFEHGFEPDSLPHREKEVRGLGENLVEALRGTYPQTCFSMVFPDPERQ